MTDRRGSDSREFPCSMYTLFTEIFRLSDGPWRPNARNIKSQNSWTVALSFANIAWAVPASDAGKEKGTGKNAARFSHDVLFSGVSGTILVVGHSFNSRSQQIVNLMFFQFCFGDVNNFILFFSRVNKLSLIRLRQGLVQRVHNKKLIYILTTSQLWHQQIQFFIAVG